VSTRHERRAKEHQIRKLEAEIRTLRANMAAAIEKKSAVESEMEVEIEQYVDSLAVVAALDDSRDVFNDDNPLYEALASWQWRGVQTAEQAKEMMVQEVARRSVSKGDLGLLLSSIDQTANILYKDMPDSLKTHEDPATFADAAVARMIKDDLASDLLTDGNWVNLRERWIRFHWRGCTSEETFNAAFLRAVADRIAEMRLRNGRMLDTVLDDELAKVSPVTRQAFIEGFRRRLDAEYERLPKGKHREDVETTFNRVLAEEVAPEHQAEVGRTVLDRLKLEHGVGMLKEVVDQVVKGTVDRCAKEVIASGLKGDAIEAFAHERIVATLGASLKDVCEGIARASGHVGALDVDDTQSIEMLLVEAVMAKARQIGAGAKPPSLATAHEFSPDGPYSDHLLMRFGRIGWEETYARGMTDQQVWDEAMRRASESTYEIDNRLKDAALMAFSPKWAVHAFQRLMTSHTFAAALMCSDVQREVLEGIEKQWDAFMVLVPNGMLISDGLEVSRLLVANYSFGAQMILLSTQPNGMVRMLLDEASTIPDLLVGDGSDLDAVTAAHRCTIMAKRLVAGLLLNLQQPSNVKIRKVEARPKSKGREAEPEHRIVTIGKPLTIDCRASVKEYIEHGPRKGKHSPPTVQVMVRGFFRNQPYGPRSSLRRVQWIEPFWRGPEAALIQTRAKVPG
jgi:hypothetical protein